MKKRDIILVFVVIAFGLLFNAIRKGKVDFSIHRSISSKAWELKDRDYPHHFPQEEIRFDLVDKIEIRNIAGNVEVEKAVPTENTEDADNPRVVRILPTISVYHKSAEQAEKIQKDIRIATRSAVEISESFGDKIQKKLLVIETKSDDDFPFHRARVNYKLILPDTVELKLDTKYGDMEIKGGGKAVSLDAKHGDVSVKNITANLDITHDYGRVTVLEVNGNINLNSRNSRIKINNVPALVLDCYLAKVYINQVAAETVVKYAGYSTITMEEGGGFSLEGRHNRIKLKDIKNHVHIKNSHKPIYMKDITGNVIINANNCRVDMEHISGDEVTIKNAYNSVAIDQISAKNLDILVDNGDLDIAFEDIKEKITIKNTHSKITLIFPDSLQPLFNLQVLYGNITNRTAEEFSILSERQRVWMNSARTEGKPEIIISTTYGDILLENSNKKKLVLIPTYKHLTPPPIYASGGPEPFALTVGNWLLAVRSGESTKPGVVGRK